MILCVYIYIHTYTYDSIVRLILQATATYVCLRVRRHACMCVYTYIHTCVHTHIHTYIVCVYVCAIWMYVAFAQIWQQTTFPYMSMRECVCLCIIPVWVRVCAHVYVCVYAYMHLQKKKTWRDVCGCICVHIYVCMHELARTSCKYCKYLKAPPYVVCKHVRINARMKMYAWIHACAVCLPARTSCRYESTSTSPSEIKSFSVESFCMASSQKSGIPPVADCSCTCMCVSANVYLCVSPEQHHLGVEHSVWITLQMEVCLVKIM